MFTTYGALIGRAIAIILIIRKVTPAYALICAWLAVRRLRLRAQRISCARFLAKAISAVR